MKARIIVLVSLAAIIAGAGWHESLRLSELRVRRQHAQREAARLAIESRASDEVAHKSARPRDPKAADDRQVVAEAISLVVDFEAAKKARSDSGGDTSAESFEKLRKRLEGLSAAQVRRFIAEIRAREDISEAARKLPERIAIGSLLGRSPGEGLDLYVETNSAEDARDGGSEVERALGSWAAKDSGAALEWIRRNLEKHGDFLSDSSKSEVIKQIASSNRKLAFQLIDELAIRTPAAATQSIVESAKTAEERTAAIADLREYLPKIRDEDQRFQAGDHALASMGTILSREGFEAATRWAESAGLTNSELASFGSSFGTSIKNGEQAEWMEWFAKKLPDNLCERPIRQVMKYWAEEDYKAAGAWINNTPDGTMKQLAISAYACTVSNFEPEAAVQWAVTLPPGKLRVDTLHKIYHNWPTKDAASEAAAAAFERQYQIQHDH